MKNLRYRIPTALLTLCLSASIGLAQPLSTYAEESTDYTIEETVSNTSEDNSSKEEITTSKEEVSGTEKTEEASSEKTEESSSSEKTVEAANTEDTSTSQQTEAVNTENVTTTQQTDADADVDVPESQEVTNDTSDEDNGSITEAEAETEVISLSKAEIREQNLNRWMNVCATMLKNLKKYHFKYGNGGTKKTFKKACAKKRRCNCALYVSWCLQKYGITKGSSVYYVTGGGKLHKNFKWNRSKVQVIRVNKKVSSAHLKKGDIVCYKGIAHTNVYAGKDSHGNRLWYDGGKISTASNKNGSRYTRTGRKSLSYLNKRKISYIIRIKNL